MHFLTKDEVRGPRAVGKPWAFVKVKVERVKQEKRLVIQEGIMVCKADTLVVDLPNHYKIIDLDGKVLKRPKKSLFVVTIETLDPYHAIAEVW